jgi:integrase
VTDQELLAVRAVAPPDIAAAIDLTLLTALRVGDLLGLRWSDVSAEGLRVTHEKTKARRLYQMTPGLAEVLERIRRLRRRVGSLYLFARADGQRYPRGDWGARWQRVKRRAGLDRADLHWHDLRARALTDAARAQGRDYAQALAGHASGDQTEAYVRARETVPVRPLR